MCIDKVKIERLAKKILIDNEIVVEPIEPVSVAKKMEIKVLKNSFIMVNQDRIYGLIHSEKDDNQEVKYKILINKDDDIYRQRFTIAHELGHYYLHLKDSKNAGKKIDMLSFSGYSSKNKEEQEANYFAGALLMPKNKIKMLFETYRNIGIEYNLILRVLSRKFVVSEAAVDYRLSSLGLK